MKKGGNGYGKTDLESITKKKTRGGGTNLELLNKKQKEVRQIFNREQKTREGEKILNKIV